MKAAIIGGGISGLTTAYLLSEKGIEVKLFEKNSFPGGNIRTENINGFLIEHGPNSTLETTPLINTLLESLGIMDRKIYATQSADKRYILKGGKLLPLPMSPRAFIKTKLFSASAKLRLLKEPFIKSKSSELETIGEFTQRRLGKEFLDYAINPFVAGVFAGDPFNLNVKTAFPKLYELEQEYGSLIKGQIKSSRKRKKTKEKSKQSAKTFSFIGGLRELVDAIYSKIKDSVSLNTQVIKIIKKNGPFEVTSIKDGSALTELFDAVVMASPAHNAACLLDNFNHDLSEDLKNSYYPPVAVIMTGFKNDAFTFKPDGFGFLVPEKENRKILGSLWNSVIFPHRAPEGYSLLTNFIGGSRQPGLCKKSDDELLEITLSELNSIMGLTGKPEFVKIVKWQEAIPQYSKNHAKLTEKLDKFQEETRGMFICSNYYKGISVCDCIKNAFGTVEKIKSLDTHYEAPAT
jgi:oxygen-dependent protoporphyrinogen oxidase